MKVLKKLGIQTIIICAFTVSLLAEEGSWNYAESEKWGEYDPSFRTCSEGTAQSPINIKEVIENGRLRELNLDYHPSPMHDFKSDSKIEFNYARGSFLTFNDEKYELVSIHFHRPSEHQVEGKSYPIEIHLVHRNVEKELAVVGILVEEGQSNQFFTDFESIIPYLLGKNGEKNEGDREIDVRNLLPQNLSYYHYKGSLTTPPCSEAVNWILFQNPIPADAHQIQLLIDSLSENARPVQQLHDRKVELYKSK